jgi:uncharacterized protein (DUF2225 family)
MSSPLWNKKIKCAFCGTEFETSRMRSSAIRVTEKESDFGSLYEGENPYFYSVTACPGCTFAAFNKDYDVLRFQAEPKILEATKKIRAAGLKKPDIFALGSMTPEAALKRHDLAIAFMKLRVYPNPGVLARLYLEKVWLYRLIKDFEKEKTAMAEAAQAYEDFHQKGNTMPENLGEPGVLYLIGELYRRRGLYKDARRFYEKALASKEIKAFPRIAEMTRDMMLSAKEQMIQAGTD